MNAELRLQDISFPGGSRPHGIFRLALAVSLLMHFAGFLTSPYWQPDLSLPDEFISVDIADVPPAEMPKIPRLPAESPAPEAASPQARRDVAAPPAPPPAPTREMIREKIADRGVLKMLSRKDPGGTGAGDPLSGIRLPADVRYSSRGAPGAADYRPTGKAGETPSSPRPADPGIGKQVASSGRSSTALSSRVFRTDSGLEGTISGAADDETRSSGAIAGVVRQYQSGIKFAYNKELLSNPRISGKITVSFVILPDGSVESVEVRQSSVNWPALEEAVVKRMKHWKFSRTRGGAVGVVFPFVFNPEM